MEEIYTSFLQGIWSGVNSAGLATSRGILGRDGKLPTTISCKDDTLSPIIPL